MKLAKKKTALTFKEDLDKLIEKYKEGCDEGISTADIVAGLELAKTQEIIDSYLD